MPLRIALGIVLVQLVICNSIHGQYEDVSAHGVYIGMCYAARYFIAHLRQTNAKYVRLGNVLSNDKLE